MKKGKMKIQGRRNFKIRAKRTEDYKERCNVNKRE
jgi:hypothetical protein